MKLVRSRRRLSAALVAAAGLALGTAVMVPTPAHAVAPSNDNFASATTLSGVSATGFGDNTDATEEAGEPLTTSYGNTFSHTLWWRWTAPISGSYAVSTAGSTAPGSPAPVMDTTLSVYTGSSLSSLNRVATNDDRFGIDNTSSTGFTATAGTTYYIQAAGYHSTTGTIRLSLGAADVTGTVTFEPQAPANTPDEACLEFYNDSAFTQVVASSCGSGDSGTTDAFAIGLIPAGTYYLKVTDDNKSTYYPTGVLATATPIVIPGGGCTLTGLTVNFATNAFTAPTGKSCPFVPACQQARGAASQAAATLSVANAALSTAQAQVTADQKAIAATKLAIKKAKKKHRSTTALTKKLAKLTQRLAVDNATLAAARTAATFATAGQASAAAAVNGSC